MNEKQKETTPLQQLVSKSVFAYLILPVPSMHYYEGILRPIIKDLKKGPDKTVKFGERDKGYIEIYASVGEKDYTTDWDVLMERAHEKEELEKENRLLKREVDYWKQQYNDLYKSEYE